MTMTVMTYVVVVVVVDIVVFVLVKIAAVVERIFSATDACAITTAELLVGIDLM